MVRKANLSDINFIFSNYSLFDNYWTSSQFLSEKDKLIYIILDDSSQEILGFVIFRDCIDCFEILNICIREDKRHRGYGKKLLTSSLSNISPKKDIFLEVAKNNLNAIFLYENIGFKKVSARQNYYKIKDSFIDAIVYSYTF